MAKTGYSLILRVQTMVQDEGGDQMSLEEFVRELNAGQSFIANNAGDANLRRKSMRLAPGARQSVPADCLNLNKVVRNLGSDGGTAGDLIHMVDHSRLDKFDPDWEQGTAATTVEEASFLEDRKAFRVYPPASDSTNVWVELLCNYKPTEIVYDSGGVWQSAVITIDDKYEEALVEWLQYRWYAKDSESVENAKRALIHEQACKSQLGLPVNQQQG